jgi:hypothetical protein
VPERGGTCNDDGGNGDAVDDDGDADADSFAIFRFAEWDMFEVLGLGAASCVAIGMLVRRRYWHFGTCAAYMQYAFGTRHFPFGRSFVD